MVKVHLGIKTIRQCKTFADTMGSLNQPHEFNNQNTEHRTPQEVTRDNLTGKMGEAGVRLWLTANGLLTSPLDLEVLGENKRDDGDLTCQGLKVSVKTTVNGRFLLVHVGQLKWETADIYVVCQFNDPKVKLLGYAYKSDLIKMSVYNDWLSGVATLYDLVGDKAEIVLEQGLLPGKTFPMKSTNLFICPENLRTNFNELLRYLYAMRSLSWKDGSQE
jgi:hypothetical protein